MPGSKVVLTVFTWLRAAARALRAIPEQTNRVPCGRLDGSATRDKGA